MTPTQADRDAAADNIQGPMVKCIRDGGLDKYPLVQAFMHHRLAARREALEEVLAALQPTHHFRCDIWPGGIGHCTCAYDEDLNEDAIKTVRALMEKEA